MKKRLISLLAMTVFVMGTLPAQDLQEILDSHFEAIGQKNLLGMETLVVTGTALMQGMELPFKFISKRPNKAYLEIEIEGAKMIQAYDGENGWMIAPWTGLADPIDLTGPDLRGLKDMADMDGPLWNYEKKGHTVELVGKEDMEGSEVYVLKVTKKEGDIDYYYMDAENFVVLKVKSKSIVNGSEVETEALMSNFQEVDGYITAFTVEQRFGGQMGMTMNTKEINKNVEIDDSMFSKPGPAPVMPVEE